MVNYIKASPVSNDSEPVPVAGDPERNAIGRRLKEGFLLDEITWEKILEAGESAGLERARMNEINGF